MDVKKILWIALLCSACNNSGTATTPVQTFDKKKTSECESSSINGEYLVQWKSGDISVEKAKSEEDFVNNFVKKNEVAIYTSEPHYKISAPVINPTPTTNPSEWGGELNWGAYDTKADKLWSQNIRGAGVIVAVVDSGVDTKHEALKSAIFQNSKEIAGNNLDDDNNGYIDDVSGYDFYNKSSEVLDPSGHGTHVSGTIASQHSDGSVLGMAPDAKILPLRFMSSDGEGTIEAAIEALDYAVLMGAKVINASWGGNNCSSILKNKIDDLGTKKVLLITAAGNAGQNISIEPEYPASLNGLLQITVGANTAEHVLAGFSNLGDLVHLAAPGANIVSSFPGGYTSLNGTSMATPHVTGAAALLISAFPNVDLLTIKKALVEQVEAGPYKVKSRGALNVYNAYTYLKQNTGTHP